jgi:hypothetical protein
MHSVCWKEENAVATSMWTRQTFSVARDGLEAITGDQVTTVMGGLVMELVSAPIAPGVYHMELTAFMGGIQLFLPANANVELRGASFWGGKQLYRDQEFWRRLHEAFAESGVQLPATPPAWAHASYAENPVTLQLTINAILGGASVYQLEPDVVATTHISHT